MDITKQGKRKTRRYCNCAHLTFHMMQDEENIAIGTFWLALSKIVIYDSVTVIHLPCRCSCVCHCNCHYGQETTSTWQYLRVSFSKTKCFKDLAEDLWRMNVQKRRQLFNSLLLFTENSTIRLVVQHLLRQFVKQNCKLKTGRSACGAEVSASCLW